MPTITSIKSQKNQKRVTIYLDGKFGFGIDLANFVKLGLKVGQKFSGDEIEELIKKAEFQKTYDKILRFATLRPRSEKEFIIWIKKHKIPKNLHTELFDRLRRLDFLNDEKFAIWWIEQRSNFRPKPKRVLERELRIKGIGKEITEKVLRESMVDEVSIALKVMEKKSYLWKQFVGYEKRLKISQYLARNGYSWDVIKKIIGQVDQDL